MTLLFKYENSDDYTSPDHILIILNIFISHILLIQKLI